MIRIIGSAAGGATDAILSVFDQAVAEGAAEPAWVAVEDEAGEWVRQAATAAPGERARAVVAVRTEAALVTAVRLGIGGAMWLPPSTVDAAAALAASELVDTGAPALDPWLADLEAGPDRPMVAVSWIHRAFWRCQVGERRMAALLAELAAELEVPPAILPWPALLVPADSNDELGPAWAAVTERVGVISEGVSVVACGPWEGHCGMASVAMAALAGHRESVSPPSDAGFARAVCELPSGRHVGRWSPADLGEGDHGPGWLAIPAGTTAHGFRWRLAGGDGEEEWLEDRISAGAGAGPAHRVPGWLAVEAGGGRPAGLLVERLAADAHRRGVPLWVPNVDQARLQFLLRLPGIFWVDGSAVPETEKPKI